MVKSTAVIVGLLFLISSVYYLVFWGHFYVDVFQYIEVSDIAKGLIYPLRNAASTLLWIVGYMFTAFCYILWSERNKNKSEEERPVKYYERRIVGLIILCAIAFSITLLFGTIHVISLYGSQLHYAVSSGRIALPTLSVTVVLAYCIIDNKIMLDDFKKGGAEVFRIKNSFYKSIDYVILMIITYLLASAFSYGIIDSKKIENHISYDYVKDVSFLEKEGLCPNNVVVYLGAINDKYFFRDYNGEFLVLVDKWKIPVLLLAHHEAPKSDLDLFDGLAEWLSRHPTIRLILLLVLLSSVVLFFIFRPWQKRTSVKRKYFPIVVIIKFNEPPHNA